MHACFSGKCLVGRYTTGVFEQDFSQPGLLIPAKGTDGLKCVGIFQVICQCIVVKAI